MQLNSVEELIADIRAGRMVILMDDEDRENEGDLVMAATQAYRLVFQQRIGRAPYWPQCRQWPSLPISYSQAIFSH